MTEKVRITQEQGEAIEKFLNFIDGDKERFLRMHVAGDGIAYWGDYCNPLNDLSIMEFAEILVNGYEVEPEYKAGDWIYSMNNKAVSKVARVGDTFVVTDTGFMPSFGYVRHATPEEIKAEKERRLWKSIGREVGEFREGDVYLDQCSDAYILFNEVSPLDDSTTIKTASYWYENEDFEGFFPAESFISFEDGDSND